MNHKLYLCGIISTNTDNSSSLQHTACNPWTPGRTLVVL